MSPNEFSKIIQNEKLTVHPRIHTAVVVDNLSVSVLPNARGMSDKQNDDKAIL